MSISSLQSIFRDKLIPWAQARLEERLIVAAPVIEKASLPYGVEVTRKEIPGKRVLVRKRDEGPRRMIAGIAEPAKSETGASFIHLISGWRYAPSEMP